MASTDNLSRERIKKRMLNDAADLWGYKRSKIEEFDPLIDLLFGASATEIKRIYDEIHSSEARILERLAELLTPDVEKGHKPAHAVASARPLDATFTLEPEELFYHILKEEKVNTNIFFSPANSIKLLDAGIAYMAFNNVLYVKKDGDFDKHLEGNKQLPGNILYLGIDIGKEVESLEHLNFFFDWKNELFEQKQKYIRALRHTSWKVEGKSYQHAIGYGASTSHKRDAHLYELSEEFDITFKNEKYVLNRYEHQFITLTQKEPLSKDLYLPEAFSSVFEDKSLSKIDPDIIWVEVSFPKVFPSQAFENMLLETNCFPTINRNLHTLPYQALQKVHIVSLEAEDFFFAMKDIISNDGDLYKPSPFIGLQEGDKRTYTLRQGGTARYDVRDSAEMLDYLFDLLRDESSAFKGLGFDILASDIKSLDKIIYRLERKKNQHLKDYQTQERASEPIHYLVVRPERAGENMEIRFWGTNGEKANDLPTGASLQSYQGLNFHRNSIKLVSKSTGGRARLNSKDNLYAFKKALMNRGRVVTIEDVRTECFTLFGSRLEEVEVKHGVALSSQSRKGMERTLDVILTPAEDEAISSEECEELLASLSAQSTGILPFRVFSSRKEEGE